MAAAACCCCVSAATAVPESRVLASGVLFAAAPALLLALLPALLALPAQLLALPALPLTMLPVLLTMLDELLLEVLAELPVTRLAELLLFARRVESQRSGAAASRRGLVWLAGVCTKRQKFLRHFPRPKSRHASGRCGALMCCLRT